MPKTGFLARWNVQVRSNSQLAALQSPGLARSYPMLAAEDERLQTRHFYHVADQVGPNQLHLGPPLGCVEIDLADGSLLAAYGAEQLGIESFEEMIYVVPPERQPVIRANVRRLRELYDVIVEQFPDEPSGEEGPAFWDALKSVVPPLLLPAYEALSPEFLAWLQG
jgi:hypothetical protein